MQYQVPTSNKCRTKMLQRDSMKLGNSLKRKRHQPRDIEEFKKKCCLQKPNTNRPEDPKIEGVPQKEVRKAITNNSTHATLAQVVTPGAVSQSRLFCHFVVAILMMTSAQGTISFLVC